jgi:LysM repeat protein
MKLIQDSFAGHINSQNMECPVCKNINKPDQRKCAVCSTDLEIYHLINQLEIRAKRQRKKILFLFLLLAVCLIFAFVWFTVFFEHNAGSDKIETETVRQQEMELQHLKNENQKLMADLIKLRNELQTIDTRITEASAKTEEASVPSSPAYREIVHVVKRGESLKRIALKYYGNSDEYARIMRDNNIKNPNHITINQRLKILVPVAE